MKGTITLSKRQKEFRTQKLTVPINKVSFEDNMTKMDMVSFNATASKRHLRINELMKNAFSS